MATRPATEVVASFNLLPGRQAVWEDVYTTIIQKEQQDPASGLRKARLLRDIHDDTHLIIVGEWDSPEAFDRFVRSGGLLWESRGLEYEVRPAEVTYLETIWDGA